MKKMYHQLNIFCLILMEKNMAKFLADCGINTLNELTF